MNLLLDTNALIWWMLDSKKLGKRARHAIVRPGARLFLSSASVWEISIKSGMGKLRLKEPAEKCIPHLFELGFLPLAITFQHALAAGNLPLHHQDPFDRMLIAQAQCEDLTLLTGDPAIMAYDVRTIDASD
ncbi:MAG TPA: type II toxin-antitoxin system VapC family toxin [Bryobacteraceae bacterium]|jgi:PIN domain nuclease of toxin-antitoxin system